MGKINLSLTVPKYCNLTIGPESFVVSVCFPIKDYMVEDLKSSLTPIYCNRISFFKKKNVNYVKVEEAFDYSDYNIQKVLRGCARTKATLCEQMAIVKANYYISKASSIGEAKKSLRHRDIMRIN